MAEALPGRPPGHGRCGDAAFDDEAVITLLGGAVDLVEALTTVTSAILDRTCGESHRSGRGSMATTAAGSPVVVAVVSGILVALLAALTLSIVLDGEDTEAWPATTSSA